MAGITIPLITEFKDKGIKQAMKEFKALQTTGEKAQFALKKAALPAIMALGALAAAGGKAIAAGEALSTANARILQINKSMNLFGADTKIVSDRLIKLAEATAMQTGMDNLSIKATQAKLLTFKNLAKTADQVGGAFDRATVAAIDLAAAGFGEAESNAIQLGKALEDPIKGIAALSKSGVTFTAVEKEKIKALVESGNVLAAQEIILKALETQVGGTAVATANSTDIMKEGFAQFTQQLGLALLPVLAVVTPLLLGMAKWAKDNPGVFLAVAGAIAAIATAIILANVGMKLYAVYTKAAAAATWLLNVAMNANPFTLIIIAIVAAIAVMVVLYKKVEFFRKVVHTVVKAVVAYFQMVINVWITVINALIRGYNLIPFLKNIKELNKVDFSGVTDSAKNLGKVMGVSAERAKELQAQYAELRGEALAPLTEELKKTATAVASVDSAWKILTGTLSRTVALDDAQVKVNELAAAAKIAFATGSNSDIVKYNKAASDMANVISTLAAGFDTISSKEILLRFKTTGPQSALDLAAWLAGGGELKGLSTYDLLTQSGIPGLASGGKVAGGGMPYIVGEKGPELFTPRSSGTITPNGATVGGGSTNVTINVQGADPNAVVQALQRYVRTSGPVPVNIRNM